MRKDIEFKTEDGVMLCGWLYVPDRVSTPVPAVVMAHGFSAVKEMYLDRYADAFADRGMAALVFDNRNFGASEGHQRQHIDPWQQVRDYRDAITFAGENKSTVDHVLATATVADGSTTITLPDGADVDRLNASLEKGVLSIAVPKRQEVQPKKIAVKAETQQIKS